MAEEKASWLRVSAALPEDLGLVSLIPVRWLTTIYNYSSGRP